MVSKRWIKTKILVKQNRVLLFLVFLWFSVSFIIFSLQLPLKEAIEQTFFLNDSIESNYFSHFYGNWSGYILFGVVIAFLLTGFYRKYNPMQVSEMMAREMSNHVILIGYTHLSMRMVEHLKKTGEGYIVVEPEKSLVEELIEDEEPVIVEDPKDVETLKEANVDKAKAVLITVDDIETSVVVSKRVRDLNKECKIIARCYHDDIADVLEHFDVEVISTSKWALEKILPML